MTKTAKRLSFALLLLAIAAGVFFAYKSYRKSHGVYIETLKVGNDAGWGYKIYVNGKMVVNQYIMPAMPGNRAFPCESAAKKTAELVVKKVAHGESPSVTVGEVESILKDNCR